MVLYTKPITFALSIYRSFLKKIICKQFEHCIMKKLLNLSAVLALCFTMLFMTACQKSYVEASLQNLTDVPEEVVICVIFDETPGSTTIKSENRFAETTQIGHCWSKTNPEPTIGDFKTVQKGAKKVFTETLKYLEAETTYFVRAYAIKKDKPEYSKVMVFTTLKTPIKIVPEL